MRKCDFDAGCGVFAEIASPDGSSSAKLGVNFSADKAGGIATPNLGVSALTREHGPVAGTVADAAADNFDPAQFFPKGSASLFGSFDIGALLLGGALGDQAPKMRTATTDAPPDKVVKYDMQHPLTGTGTCKFTNRKNCQIGCSLQPQQNTFRQKDVDTITLAPTEPPAPTTLACTPILTPLGQRHRA